MNALLIIALIIILITLTGCGLLIYIMGDTDMLPYVLYRSYWRRRH